MGLIGEGDGEAGAYHLLVRRQGGTEDPPATLGPGERKTGAVVFAGAFPLWRPFGCCTEGGLPGAQKPPPVLGSSPVWPG